MFLKVVKNTLGVLFILGLITSCSKSSDISAFQLKGNVKCYIIDGDTLSFSQSGELQSIKSATYKDVVINHDDNGRLKSLVCEENDNDLTISLYYDDKGVLTETHEDCKSDYNASNKSERIIYTYNKNGLRCHESHIMKKYGNDSEDRDYEASLRYVKFDSHGNWTKRIVKYNDDSKEYVEERNIFYY